MKNIFFIILTFFFQYNILAQNYELKSLLQVENKNEKIAFATISFSNSLLAITSDSEGIFSLVFNKNILPDTLEIRHLSFEPIKIFITIENYNSFKTIYLKENKNEISEATVKGKKAKTIIQQVIDNLDLNHHTDNYLLNGFYRQKHKENNKYVRLIESFVTVNENIDSRISEKQKELFKIKEIRRSNIYERNGDKHGDHIVDLFSENPINYTSTLFLNDNNIFNYDFSYMKNENNKIKIHFQNKPWQMPHNKNGYIVINKADMAILEIEVSSTKNMNFIKNNKSNWKFQNGVYKAKFVKENGKYYCSKSSKYYNHYVLNENLGNVDFIVEEYFEWTTNTFESNIKNEQDITFKKLSNLYSIEYKYDSEFWLNAKSPKIESKVFSDLNSFKSLEKQFIDD